MHPSDMQQLCNRNENTKNLKESTSCRPIKIRREPSEARNFRPISLLCQTFELMERLILKSISTDIRNNQMKEHAGFRSWKSCCGPPY